MHTSIKRNITVAVVSSLLVLGNASCQKDLLDPIPKTLISDQVVFDTPARIELQVNGMYNSVKSGNFLGGRYQVYSDVRANDFINRTSNGVTALAVWNHTLTEASANDVVSLWGAGYAAINQINVFLAGMDANAAKFVAPIFPADYATKTALNYKAEARFLRALSYYSLLQLYARPYVDGNGSKPGLPLRLLGETNSLNNDLARSSVAEVYTQILADLDFAEQNLPLAYTADALNVTPAALNVSRAHRNTAIALKTRVYLTMGKYDDVIREANKIVPTAAPFAAATGVRNSLSASVAAVFSTPPQTNNENILNLPFTAQNAPGTQNQLAYYFSPGPVGNGEYGLNTGAGSIFSNPAWAATDARRTSFVVQSGTEYFMRKYSTGSPYTDSAPVIRYAEVLLSLAEARFRTAGATDAQALALLNAVRTRSNPAGAYTAFATPAAAVDAVLLERRIEFLAEGIRNIDIMRLNATIPGKGTVSAVAPDNPLYVWPIPNTELATNRDMTRN